MTGDNSGTGQEKPAQQQVGIHNLYLKDVSFEAPNTPGIFRTKEAPKIQMNLGVNTSKLDEQTFEVVISVTVEAKTGEQTAFLVEVHQAGIFTIVGFNEENLAPVLGIYCPNLLYPYAREAVSSLVTKGGFPALILEPVNFEAVFAQQQQKAKQKAEQDSGKH